MSNSANVKSFKLELSKVIQGKPKSITMCCTYAYYGLMAGGWVVAVNDQIKLATCFNEGLKDSHAFMCTDKIVFNTNEGEIFSYRLGFQDNKGVLSGFMMQGASGNDIIATENFNTELLKTDAYKA